jgi:hypothetical protein
LQGDSWRTSDVEKPEAITGCRSLGNQMNVAKSPGCNRQFKCQGKAHPLLSHKIRFEKTIVRYAKVMSLMAGLKVYISTVNTLSGSRVTMRADGHDVDLSLDLTDRRDETFYWCVSHAPRRCRSGLPCPSTACAESIEETHGSWAVTAGRLVFVW